MPRRHMMHVDFDGSLLEPIAATCHTQWQHCKSADCIRFYSVWARMGSAEFCGSMAHKKKYNEEKIKMAGKKGRTILLIDSLAKRTRQQKLQKCSQAEKCRAAGVTVADVAGSVKKCFRHWFVMQKGAEPWPEAWLHRRPEEGGGSAFNLNAMPRTKFFKFFGNVPFAGQLIDLTDTAWFPRIRHDLLFKNSILCYIVSNIFSPLIDQDYFRDPIVVNLVVAINHN